MRRTRTWTILQRSLRQIEELFLIVVVGEFNAGKTAFLNALLGQKALPEGITPTTSQIHVVRHTDGLTIEPPSEDYRIVRAPVDWLRELNLVDTPGTNAVIQRHQEITETFIPRSDLVLFVTSVERPFTESERALPGAHQGVGQEDRSRGQQDRPCGRGMPKSRRSCTMSAATRRNCCASRRISSPSARA